jgi:hypothetical protein
MTVSYNLETQDLRVTISHQVSDPEIHYISKVEIKKNDVVYNTSIYVDQSDANSFSYTYKINATVGDTIEVTASCNQGGSKTVQHTVTKDNTDEEEKSTPGFELIFFIGAIVTSLILLRKRYC